MRRKFRPLNLQTASPTLEDLTRRTPTRRHFELLTGASGIPPIPLIGSVYRACFVTPITDTEGLSQANWSTGTTGSCGSIPASDSNWNYFYHYWTVPNLKRSPTYTKIMQPVRITVAAPSTDGGQYDFWTTNTSGARLLVTHSGGFEEICPEILPTDSHAAFKDGWCEIALNQSMSAPFFVTTRASTPSSQIPANLASINPTYTWGYTTISVYAIQKRRNGSAVGTVIVNPKLSGPEWQLEVSKGDTIELDVWYKITGLTGPSETTPNLFGSPGRGYAYRPTSVVSTGRQHYNYGAPVSLGVQPFSTIQISNVNFSPQHNWTRQTYNITVAGHIGWTLKDGSDGPHKMYAKDNWTLTATNGQLLWKNLQSTSFKQIRFSYNREIPLLELKGGGTDYVAAGGSASDVLWYRPEFGSSTSYRQNTAFAEVRSGTGSTWRSANTAVHPPSGVFDQNGSTTFEIAAWSTGTVPVDKQAWVAPLPSVAGHIPTTVTLTQVPL